MADWLSARGALADVWDGEPAEAAIRRIRDGQERDASEGQEPRAEA